MGNTSLAKLGVVMKKMSWKFFLEKKN